MSDVTNYETPRPHLTRAQRRERMLTFEQRLGQAAALSPEPPTIRGEYDAWKARILQSFADPEPQQPGENEAQGAISSPEQQPLLLASETRSRPLVEMFNLVQGPYQGADEGNRFSLPADEIHPIDNPEQYIFAQQLPFIILDGTDTEGYLSWHANQAVVPYAYDNPDAPPGTPLIDSTIIRYANGELVTGGDSGLFALCAAATPNPEDQARLFAHLAEAVTTIHENNPDLQLNWLAAQREEQQTGFPGSSLDVLAYNDFEESLGLGATGPRRNEERLILNDQGKFDETDFSNRCRTMVTDLKAALTTGNLEPYQLRQLEFLAHSIDTAGIFKDLQTPSI